MVYFLSFTAAALFSFILTVPTIILAKKYKLVTDKTKRYHPAHTHQGIIPRGGGLPIYLALLASCFIFIDINKIMIGILLAGFLLVVLGLLDDYFDISPYARFVANILISATAIGFGLGIPYIFNPFGGIIRLDTWKIAVNFLGSHHVWVLADLLAIIWLSWTMNMVNWSKGVDGQLPGFVGITAFFLGLLSQRFTAHDISVESVVIFAFIVSGSYIGFLPFNFYPQKIMPGYGGGALAGFLLGVLSILSFGKVGTAILIMAVPTIDAFYTIVRRLKNRRSPFRADWGHLHHRLLEIGWGKRRIAVFYWTVSLILGLVSLWVKGIYKLIIFLTIAVVILIFIMMVNKIKRQRKTAFSKIGQ
jgi:UDP-GlcNAc:undecaprenyl-phosphate GlcNAc-1-phosphate transferase